MDEKKTDEEFMAELKEEADRVREETETAFITLWALFLWPFLTIVDYIFWNLHFVPAFGVPKLTFLQVFVLSLGTKILLYTGPAYGESAAAGWWRLKNMVAFHGIALALCLLLAGVWD